MNQVDMDLVRLEVLGRDVVARVARGDKYIKDGEDHHLAAGLLLKEAHALVMRRRDMTWAGYLQKHVPLKATRVYLLMRVANGQTTMSEIRAANAKRQAETMSRYRASATGARSAEKMQSNQPAPLSEKVEVAALGRALRKLTPVEMARLFRPFTPSERAVVLHALSASDIEPLRRAA